jgi:hypothetical protein
MVMHSGNHEVIGIRHHKTQTLYISDVIEPHSCSNPAYGKIQVGIYIAAVQETIDRARQDIEARDKSARHPPPADISLKNEEAKPDTDLGYYSPEGRLDLPNGAGDRVVKTNGRTDMKGTRNTMQQTMQAEWLSMTRFGSACFFKPNLFMIAPH